MKLAEARYVGDRMWRRWNRALERRGFDSLRDRGGLDVRMASLMPGDGSGLHEYFVKLSHEVAGGQAKLAKGGGRTPFQILSDALDNGEAADVLRLVGVGESQPGTATNCLVKGPARVGEHGKEQTDEEIAEEQLEAEDVLFLEPESWGDLRRSPAQVCDLLEVTEDGGYPAAMPWLDRHGLGYVVVAVPPPLPPPPRDHEHWQLRRDRLDEARATMGVLARELADAHEWQRLLKAVDCR